MTYVPLQFHFWEIITHMHTQQGSWVMFYKCQYITLSYIKHNHSMNIFDLKTIFAIIYLISFVCKFRANLAMKSCTPVADKYLNYETVMAEISSSIEVLSAFT